MPARQRTAPRIGVLLPLSIAYGRGIFKGVVEYVNQHPGWQLVRTALPTGRRALTELRRLQFDALIAAPADSAGADLFQRCAIPCVNVSNQIAACALPSVFSDDTQVGRLAA